MRIGLVAAGVPLMLLVEMRTVHAQIDMAHVVFQVRIDTTGRADPRTLRVRRSSDVAFDGIVRQELGQLTFPPEEPVPGCRVVFVATVPLRFSR